MRRNLLKLTLIILLSLWFGVAPAYSQDFPKTVDSGSLNISPETADFIQNKILALKRDLETEIKNEISIQEARMISEFNEKYAREVTLKEVSLLHFNTVKHLFDETKSSLETLAKYSIISIGVLTAIAATIATILIGRDYKQVKQVREEFNDEIKEVQESRKKAGKRVECSR
jgi:hypothetical protein